MKTTLPIFRSSLLLFSLATFGLLSAPLLMAQRAVSFPPAESKPPPAAKAPPKTQSSGEETDLL